MVNAYYEANREKMQAINRDWHKRNPERSAAAAQAWYEANKKRKQEKRKEWYLRNRERVAEQRKANRLANWEHVRALEKEKAHRRRAATIGEFTTAQWQAKLAYFDNRCAYCFAQTESLEQEHVVPLSRGGRHDDANIVPACRSCNAHKYNRTPREWLVA